MRNYNTIYLQKKKMVEFKLSVNTQNHSCNPTADKNDQPNSIPVNPSRQQTSVIITRLINLENKPM